MDNSHDNEPWLQGVEQTSLADITISNLLSSSLNTTFDQDLPPSETEIQHQQFLNDEAVCNVVDDIVTNVEDVKGSPIKSPKNLIEFSIVSQSNVNDSITNDADAEFDVEPNTEKINDMIQKLFMATEMIDMPPIKTPPKGAGYVVTSNTTLTVDTQQLFGFNESMQSVGAVAIDDCEDEEDNEDANASKTSAKRQMNESIMSIGDPMATAERKKNKESLNDSITSEPSFVDFTEDFEDKENCKPSNLELSSHSLKSNTSNREVLKEIDVSKEEISDRDNESTLMTSKVLDSSFPKANQEDGAERKDDSTLINSRFFNSSFHKANQEDGTADEQKVGAESKDESTLITSRFFNSSLNKTNQEDGAERKDESTLITSRFFDSSFHKANKEDVVERKDDSTLITSRFFNSSFHKGEQKVGADSKNESTLITSRFFDSSLNKSNQEDGAGRKDESTLITSKLFDLSFPGAKDPMNSTFSADNVNNLLETKLDYENKIVVLKENVEELQKKLSTSDDALSATKSQLSEQLANHEQLLSKFNDTKSSYDRMVDNFKEKIEVLNQQLAEANRQILEKATDLDATFSLEDRVELLQTKVTYEEEIIQMKEDIEALHQNLQESNDKIMQKQNEYQRARQVFDGLKAEYDARQQALQTELDKMKTMYQDLLQSKAMAEAQVQSFAEMLEEANSKLKQKADESFTLEDRKELIQTKLDYENMILKLNDDIDSCKKLLDDEKEKRQQIEELNTRLHKMNIQLEEAVANQPEVHSAEMQTSMIEQSFTAEDRAELIQAKLNDEKKIEELVAQLAEATKSCTLYMQQCQSTANGLEDAQQQLAAVKAELASTQDNLKAAKDAHEVAVADWKAKLETEMAEHSAIVDQLNVAMNQLKEDYETTLVKEHNQLKVKFDQLSAQLTNLEGQKDAWEKTKATLDEQLDKYHSMVEANRTEIDDLTNGKQRAETELAEARQAIEVAKANNETKLKSLQDEITIFVDTLAETKEELGQAKQEIEAISADKSQLQHAIDNLSLESQQTKEQCSQLLADNSNLSLRVESLCKAGAQKDDTIQQLNDEIAQLKLKLENAEMSKSKVAMEMSVKHQEAIATLTNKNEALEKNVQKMADQRVALLKEKDEVETNFWNVTTSKESMKVKYEKTVADLEDNLAKTKVELAKMAEESERSASQAEEKISDLSRHNAGLVEQMKTAKMAEAAKAEKHQQKLAELAHDKEQLEAECDQLNSQLGLMKTEKDALAEKIDKLSGEKTRFESLLADCLASHSVITPEVIGGEQQLQALDFYFKSQHDQLHKKEAELQEARANIANLTSEMSKMEALKADCKIMKASLGKRKDLIEQYQARLEEVARRNKLHKATINVGMKGFQKVGAESKQLITELQNIIGKLEKNPDEQASVKAAVVRNLFNTIIKRLNNNIASQGQHFLKMNDPEYAKSNPDPAPTVEVAKE